MACLILVGELALFPICALLLTQTVIHHGAGSEFAQFSMCTILVKVAVAHVVSVCELPWFSMCTLLVIQTGLSCFRM